MITLNISNNNTYSNIFCMITITITIAIYSITVGFGYKKVFGYKKYILIAKS